MATPLRRIEKEFILGAARDEGIDLILVARSGEWPVRIQDIGPDSLVLTHALPLRLLKLGEEYEFRLRWREQFLAFRARLQESSEARLRIAMPGDIFKNLGRRYGRRRPPKDFAATLSLGGDRYELAFPQAREFDPVQEPEPSADFDPGDLRLLIHEFNERAAEVADEKSLSMYRGRQPEGQAEKAVARTGRILYLPSSFLGLPATDPYPEARIITRGMFADWLREEGVAYDLVEGEVLAFERGYRKAGIRSLLVLPILFQEYVVGCASLAVKDERRPDFDLSVLETFQQFTKVLAWSLKLNGYFRQEARKAKDYPTNVVDLSAGGILFATSSEELATALLAGAQTELSLRLEGRRIRAKGRVQRVYRDERICYYGIAFEDLEPEDFRFLYETLYGKELTDAQAANLPGIGGGRG